MRHIWSTKDCLRRTRTMKILRLASAVRQGTAAGTGKASGRWAGEGRQRPYAWRKPRQTSRLPLPVDPSLADALRAHWQRSLHREPCDWVFANRKGKPRWQESILRRHIKPAAVRVGVGKIGWHTFRHSYSSLLRRVGADIKVQQELLRNSTIQSTMNVYTQAMSEGKRAANSVVVRSVLPCETCCGVMGA